MPRKLARILRRATLGKIARVAADDAPDCADAGCNQTAVGQCSDPDRQIHPILHQIGDVVG